MKKTKRRSRIKNNILITITATALAFLFAGISAADSESWTPRFFIFGALAWLLPFGWANGLWDFGDKK